MTAPKPRPLWDNTPEESAVLEALMDDKFTSREIRDWVGLSSRDFKTAIERLIAKGVVCYTGWVIDEESGKNTKSWGMLLMMSDPLIEDDN